MRSCPNADFDPNVFAFALYSLMKGGLALLWTASCHLFQSAKKFTT